MEGISYSLQKIALGHCVGMRSRGFNSQTPNTSSLRAHPLRSFKFYFQIHSDLSSKVGLSWRNWQLGTIRFLHGTFQNRAQPGTKIRPRTSTSPPKQLSRKYANGMQT